MYLLQWVLRPNQSKFIVWTDINIKKVTVFQIMDKQKEILTSEWIGSIVKIINATNKSLIDVEGKIIDETKHTFTILTLNKNKENYNNKKKVLKKGCVFQVTQNSITYIVEGSLLEKKPEERIKIK